MTDEKRPDPLDDVKKGLGLLFRAAKSTVAALPTDNLEKVITTGAEEVKRAFVNVSQAIEREMRGSKPPEPPGNADSTEAQAPKPAETQNAAPPDEPHVRIAKDDSTPLK